MGNARKARDVRDMLGGLVLAAGERDAASVLIAAEFEPAAADKAESAAVYRRRSDVASRIGTAVGLRIKCSTIASASFMRRST